MSIFESIMLICFGAAWPFSIYKTWKSGETAGKSMRFLYVIFVGYVSGVIHKILHGFDPVSYLYILNGLMVFTDILLCYRNKRRAAARDQAQG